MKLKPEELEKNGYVLIDGMNHLELIPFVKKFLHKRTWASSVYYTSVFLSFFFLLFFCVTNYRSGNDSFGKILIQISLGVLLFFALVPIHEWIHLLAYKLVGAKKTSFNINLKKFYALAVADQFVVDKREFKIVAFAPFLIISVTLIVVSYLTGEWWKPAIFTMLLTHSLGCSGDFGLLSYFEFNKHMTIVTYDDLKENVSFFYGKEK
jgi:hypothetical protein